MPIYTQITGAITTINKLIQGITISIDKHDFNEIDPRTDTITPNNYLNTLRAWLWLQEGWYTHVYDDSTGEMLASGDTATGSRTVGIGFNMDQSSALPQWFAAFWSATETPSLDPFSLETYTNLPPAQRPSYFASYQNTPQGQSLTSTFNNVRLGSLSITDQDVEALHDVTIGIAEENLINKIGVTNFNALSANQQASLVSMALNGPSTIGTGMVNAINFAVSNPGHPYRFEKALQEIVEYSNGATVNNQIINSAPLSHRRLKDAALFMSVNASTLRLPWREYQAIKKDNPSLNITEGNPLPYFSHPIERFETNYTGQASNSVTVLPVSITNTNSTTSLGTASNDALNVDGSSTGVEGNKVLIGGNSQDAFYIGSGHQLVAGNEGTDQYYAYAADITGNVLITDSDKKGALYVNGIPVIGNANRITTNTVPRNIQSGFWSMLMPNNITVTFTRKESDVTMKFSGIDKFTGKRPGTGSITYTNVNWAESVTSKKRSDTPSTNIDGEFFGIYLGEGLVGPRYTLNVNGTLPTGVTLTEIRSFPIATFALPNGNMELVYWQSTSDYTNGYSYIIGSVTFHTNGTQLKPSTTWLRGLPAPVTDWNEHYIYASGGIVAGSSNIDLQWARYPNAGFGPDYPHVITQRFNENGTAITGEASYGTVFEDNSVDTWQLIPPSTNTTNLYIRSNQQSVYYDDYDPPTPLPTLSISVSTSPTGPVLCTTTLTRMASETVPIKGAHLNDGSIVVSYVEDILGPDRENYSRLTYHGSMLNVVRLDSNCNVLTPTKTVVSYSNTQTTPAPAFATHSIASLAGNNGYAVSYNTFQPSPNDTLGYTNYQAVLHLYAPDGTPLLSDPVYFDLFPASFPVWSTMARTPQGKLLHVTGDDFGRPGEITVTPLNTDQLFAYTAPTDANLLAENGTVENGPGVSSMIGDGPTVFKIRRFAGSSQYVLNFNDGSGTENSNPDELDLSDFEEIQSFNGLDVTTTASAKRSATSYTHTITLSDQTVQFTTAYPLQPWLFEGNANKTTSTTSQTTGNGLTTSASTGTGSTGVTTGISTASTSGTTDSDPVISHATRNEPYGALGLGFFVGIARQGLQWLTGTGEKALEPAAPQIPETSFHYRIAELRDAGSASFWHGFFASSLPELVTYGAQKIGLPNYLIEGARGAIDSTFLSLQTTTMLASGIVGSAAEPLLSDPFSPQFLEKLRDGITTSLLRVMPEHEAGQVGTWVARVVGNMHTSKENAEHIGHVVSLVTPAAATYAATQEGFSTAKRVVEMAAHRGGSWLGRELTRTETAQQGEMRAQTVG